jgi:hypothetical protein
MVKFNPKHKGNPLNGAVEIAHAIECESDEECCVWENDKRGKRLNLNPPKEAPFERCYFCGSHENDVFESDCWGDKCACCQDVTLQRCEECNFGVEIFGRTGIPNCLWCATFCLSSDSHCERHQDWPMSGPLPTHIDPVCIRCDKRVFFGHTLDYVHANDYLVRSDGGISTMQQFERLKVNKETPWQVICMRCGDVDGEKSFESTLRSSRRGVFIDFC